MIVRQLLFGAVLLGFIFVRVAPSLGQDQEIQFSASPVEKVQASGITWRQPFGYRKEEPNNVYIRMTQGGFRAPTSKNFETLIKSWLADHPKADAIVVYTLDGVMRDIPDSKMKAVWVVDGSDNLNTHLIGMGGCPAGTMLLNAGDKTSLTRTEYETFARKAIEAENTAKQKRFGIWGESQD